MRSRPQCGSIVSVDAGDVHVREDGPADAPVLLLIHGFSSSVHWFDMITPPLAQKQRVLRLDLMGHGCTSASAGLDARSQARMVASVLETLGIGRLTVVGHSFGADVALALAEHRGDVSRLVIIGQAPDYSYATFPAGNAVLAHGVGGPLLHRLSPPWLIKRISRVAFAPGFRAESVIAEPNQAALDHRAMTPAMYRTVLVERRHTLADRPLDAQVRDLGLPTLAILGRHDQFYDCAKTAARYEGVGARVAVLENSGHTPQVEQPDETARLIGDFALASR